MLYVSRLWGNPGEVLGSMAKSARMGGPPAAGDYEERSRDNRNSWPTRTMKIDLGSHRALEGAGLCKRGHRRLVAILHTSQGLGCSQLHGLQYANFQVKKKRKIQSSGSLFET